MPQEKRLLVKIAHYYYEDNLTQEQIAQKMSMSRQKVNRLFNTLIDEGIITIRINDFYYHVDLENLLEKKFHLKQAVVIPKTDNAEDMLDSLGRAGAKVLEGLITPGTVLGIAWGRAVSGVATNLLSLAQKNISIVQLIGGMTHADNSVQLNEVYTQSGELVRTFADKLKATPYYMNAPAFVEDETVKASLMQEPSIRNSFDMIRKCNIGLVGIGALSENVAPFKNVNMPSSALGTLKSLGAAGNINFRYFNITGDAVPSPFDSRIIGPSLDELRRIPLIVGVAGGQEKHKAILGAIQGRYVDILITDYESATYILETV
jgi:deoxyribonucleoside regulator